MLFNEIQIRIAYADTDLMGYVYYGNYATFYERGRTELIRSLGLSYKEMEKLGVMMPVRTVTSEFLKPAYYDDLITIKTIVSEVPTSRMTFNYEIYNQNSVLLHKASTTLIFLDVEKRKPVRAPQFLLDKIKDYFEKT